MFVTDHRTSILTTAPIMATFILFDFVVYNPNHRETTRNEAFLDVAAGHFQRLSLESASYVLGNLAADLVGIAKEELRRRQNSAQAEGLVVDSVSLQSKTVDNSDLALAPENSGRGDSTPIGQLTDPTYAFNTQYQGVRTSDWL